MSCAQAINILGSFVHIAFAFRCFPSNWLAHRAQTTCFVWWLSHGRLKTNNTRQRKASSRQLSEQAQALALPPVPVINEHKAKWQTWLELILAFAWHGRVGLARHRWVTEKCNKYWNRTYESRQRKDNGRPEWNRTKANRKPIYQLEISCDSEVVGKGGLKMAKWANKLKRKLGLKSKSYYDPKDNHAAQSRVNVKIVSLWLAVWQRLHNASKLICL